MKFQITGQGWPLVGGAWLAPAGTLFDYDNPNMWTSVVARGVLPPNCTPLDAEAEAAGRAAYPEQKPYWVTLVGIGN
jgi:hypothetical protein